jgi:hypothetical protein
MNNNNIYLLLTRNNNNKLKIPRARRLHRTIESSKM